MKVRKYKSGYRFYGMSDNDKKKWIRDNFNSIVKKDLPTEWRPYYGKVLGGKNRAASAPRIEGKYVYKEFFKKMKLDQLAEIRGYKNAKDLLDNDKEFAAAIKKIYNSPNGLEYSYNSETVNKKILSFKGAVFINGEKMSNKKAVEQLDKVDKKIKRKYENFLNIFKVNYKKGMSELHFTLPTNKEINEASEEIEDIDFEGVDMISSGTKNK